MNLPAESARSLLFVPADRPDRFDKAAGCGADGLILDLEDGVAPAAKDDARRHVASWMGRGAAMLRLNAADTPWFEDDVALVCAIECAVMIPKVQSAKQIADILQRLPPVPALVLLETAAGIANAAEICAVPGVARAAFGSVDLGAELGVDPAERQAMAYARGAVVIASAANHLPPPLDGVCVDVVDAGAVQEEAQYAAALGFGGKLGIHPRQVATINRAFSPSADEISWARKILEADDGDGVTVVDGKMVDRPVLTRARRLLHQAGKTE
ncbi:HpcH/HpaI aldolase [Mycolicibacterium rhodesiae JS60]|nr:HpcH/HpaI aldolase [Mycolicibacterium rhodesiae JS60]